MQKPRTASELPMNLSTRSRTWRPVRVPESMRASSFSASLSAWPNVLGVKTGARLGFLRGDFFAGDLFAVVLMCEPLLWLIGEPRRNQDQHAREGDRACPPDRVDSPAAPRRRLCKRAPGSGSER